MKRFFPVALVLIVSVLAGCCVHSGIRHPGQRTTFIDDMKSKTVALVRMDSDGDVSPYCTGVWVSRTEIVTADHCARAAVENAVTKATLPDALKEKMIDGFSLTFTTLEDDAGFMRVPKNIHIATVKKHDRLHDLAVLSVEEKDVPKHGIAYLADMQPAVGDTVHVVGHVLGLPWTYTNGIVAAHREAQLRFVYDDGDVDSKEGPWIQVAGEVFNGNSGGGGFNDNGELIGIVSFGIDAPNESFFVHVDTIRTFLGRSTPR